MKNLFILDAAGYIYRSYFAIRNMTNAKGESTNALFGFIRSLMKLIKDFNPEHLVAVFDGPKGGQAREAIYKDYKAHRAAMPPDLLHQIHWAKQFCDLMGIANLCVPGVEADDTMGSIAVWAKNPETHIYLCTSDKDLAQLVDDKVSLLNTHKDNLVLGPKEVEETYGVPPHLIVDYLAMTGDASDNVPGISGFGPKTSAELLQKFGSLDYLLKNPQDIPNKKKQDILIDQGEQALLSRRLVVIDTSVDFPKDREFFALKPMNKTALKQFYTEMNFSSLIRELETAIQAHPTALQSQAEDIQEEVEYTLIDNEADLKDLVAKLSNEREISIETEATDFRPLHATLLGIGLGVCPNKAWYIPLNGPIPKEKVIQELKPLLANPKIGFYGHNIKYDFHVLENAGLPISNISFDTILASYILNSHSRQHSLDQLALDYFGKVKTPMANLTGKGKNQISLDTIPLPQMKGYCCEEVDYTCRLRTILQKQLEERNLMKLFENIELPLLKVLARMEKHGIYLDVDRLHTFSIQLAEDLKRLSQEIYDMAGEEFNLNSPKQLSVILFEKLQIRPPKKTATGHSTSSEVLDILKWEYPIAGKIQEYRVLEKLRSTYGDVLPHEINPHTHRIHPTFNQFVAATGRLSCQDPNLQNIPVRTEVGRKIREAFRPELPNWSFLSADYSQIELRLLAHLSEDPVLIEAFQKGEDIHTHTAAAIFNIQITQVNKELRHRAKAVNFGIIYGQQAFGLSQELGVPVKEAGEFIEMYFKKYPSVKAFLDACKDQARTTGKAVTMTGRERAIPEIHSKNIQIRNAAERLAVNTPFQGTAADIIKLAMLKIDKAIEEKKLRGYMILQIHDELVFEVPDEEIPLFESLVREEMQQVLKLKVPLLVDIAVGKNWKEC